MVDVNTFRADFTNQLSQRLEEEYDIRVKKVLAMEDGSFVVDTRNNTLVVEQVRDKEPQLLFTMGMYDYIKNNGFDNIAIIYKTKSSKYYFYWMDGLYTLSDYVDGKKYKFSFLKNEGSTIKLLGSFHKAAEGYIPPSGAKPESDWGKWMEKYKKECQNLKKYRDEVKGKVGKSPFEIMFLNKCELYIDRMEQAINILKKKGYLDIVEDSMKRRQVCLGNIKKSNFYQRKSDIAIKSLAKCRYEIIERDIAELFLGLIKYSTKKEQLRYDSMISIYNKINPLSKESVDIIKAFMLYPSEYEKICSKYYKGKSKWNEGIYVDKLINSMAIEDKKIEVITTLDGIRL